MIKYKVALTAEERAGLERLVAVGKSAARKPPTPASSCSPIRAGRQTDQEIADVLGTSVLTIGRVPPALFVSQGDRRGS